MAFYWRPNHAQRLPWHVLSLDTETQSISPVEDVVQRHVLVVGCLVYRRYWVSSDKQTKSRVTKWRFETVAELVKLLKPIVLKRKRRTYLYAHNANFDYGIINLSWVFSALGMNTECYINEKPPVIVVGKRKSSTLICLDSLNLFAFSLDSLSKAMGFEGKSDMPDVKHLDALYAYCERDTLLLSAILDRWRTFVQTHDLGNYRYTIASQAMSSFRHGYLPAKTLVQTRQDWILEKERACYLGGRTEAFFIGRYEHNITLLDVNSMYPYMMRDSEFPTRFRIYRKNTSPIGYAYPKGVKPGMATIKARLHAPTLPLVMDGRLCFPIGDIAGTWTWADIVTALPFMDDIEWVEFWAYEYRPLFQAWVEKLYAMRLKYEDEENYGFALSCKLLLNSLYGKFGQKTPMWGDVGPSSEPEGKEWVHQEESGAPLIRNRIRMGIHQVQIEQGETSHSLPLIAAEVTANARAFLYNFMELAGRENVLYCDTDSLMVNDTGYTRLERYIEPRRLGRLGVEWTSPWVHIHGAKDYEYESGVKRKGVRKSAQKLGRNVFRQDQFSSWDNMVRQGKHGAIDIIRKTKHLHRQYHKGNVGSDGVVSPFVLTRDD